MTGASRKPFGRNGLDCPVKPGNDGFFCFGSTTSASEVSYADMVARGVYRAVAWAADAYRDWTEHRRAMKALDVLERLDDRQLAELGITRRDLTFAALAMSAAKRNQARATMGYQA